MLKFKKSIVFLLMIGLLLMLAIPAMAAPKVMLDGQQLSFDVAPTIENGRTLVPLRAIFEALGANVSWDATTQTIAATKGNIQVKLQIGVQTAYKNGSSINLDVPANITNGRTLVPLRFVSEALGADVKWDGNTQTIIVTSSGMVASLSDQIKVHFIDVGQADSIYISLPDHNDILIDGGNADDGQAVVNYLTNQGVDDLELLIATHPHEDHIGGIPAVLDAFKVEKIVDSGYFTDSKISGTYKTKAESEGAVYQADNYQTYTFGNTALQILTGPETWEDINDYSVVCRLDTGDIEFLFTGDAEVPVEEILNGQLDAEILKVGHHGSNSSTSSAFLSKVKPEVAVISVGADNSYGHPTQKTIQKLQGIGSEIYRTDLNGTIEVSTDGKKYFITTIQKAPIPPAKPLPVMRELQPIPDQKQSTILTTGKFVGSTESNKYHNPGCRYAEKIASGNQIWFKDAADAQAHGYAPCGVCKP